MLEAIRSTHMSSISRPLYRDVESGARDLRGQGMNNTAASLQSLSLLSFWVSESGFELQLVVGGL